MDLHAFLRTHLPALERDEVPFNILIGMLAATSRAPSPPLDCWTVGEAGHCAARRPGRPIVLGQLDEAECRRLAHDTVGNVGAGVLGADDTAHWFSGQAASLGARFAPPIPQRIHVLNQPPRYPQAVGAARPSTAEDAPLLHAWFSAFQREATPHDPPATRGEAAKAAASGKFLLWIVADEPVAMAASTRSLRNTGAIGGVYTPPPHRGRGYAGSATAATADRILADGKTTVTLYTDLRNPASNRCYASIGFLPYCDSWHYPPAAAVAC
jgi:RimJ/RimL family protein N-acetyltransferase